MEQTLSQQLDEALALAARVHAQIDRVEEALYQAQFTMTEERTQ